MHPGRLMLKMLEDKNKDFLLDYDIRTVCFSDDTLNLILSPTKKIAVELDINGDDEEFVLYLMELRSQKEGGWKVVNTVEGIPQSNLYQAVVDLRSDSNCPKGGKTMKKSDPHYLENCPACKEAVESELTFEETHSTDRKGYIQDAVGEYTKSPHWWEIGTPGF